MKKTLYEILNSLSHTHDPHRSFVFSYTHSLEGTLDECRTEVLIDSVEMMNHGKKPNGTWELEFVGFEELKNHEVMAEFKITCRKPRFPDEAFLYGARIGVLATKKIPR